MSTTAVFDRLLDPVGRTLTLKGAKALAGLRADSKAQARIDELADKSKEGELTADEKAEYDSYLCASTFIGILQAKARAVVKRRGKAKR